MRMVAMAAVLVVACGPAVTSRQMRGPDGDQEWLAIECEGLRQGCWRRAQEACPRGFDIAEQSSQHGPYAVVWRHGGGPGRAYDGELLIRCHGAIASARRGYRDCMAPESCDDGDRCVWTSDGFGAVGRCMGQGTR